MLNHTRRDGFDINGASDDQPALFVDIKRPCVELGVGLYHPYHLTDGCGMLLESRPYCRSRYEHGAYSEA